MSQRPRTWGQCKAQDLPARCPFVSCRHHLGLEVSESGSVAVAPSFDYVSDKRRLDADWLASKLVLWSRDNDTCSLAVAERGPLVLDTVADIFALTRERIRQVETKVMRKLRRLQILRDLGSRQ